MVCEEKCFASGPGRETRTAGALSLAACQREIEEALSRWDAGAKGWTDEMVRRALEALILERGRQYSLPLAEKEMLLERLFNRYRRMDRLQPLLEDEGITDILINGSEEVYVERAGRLESAGKLFDSREQVLALIQRVCGQAGRQVTRASPLVDARLPDGSRIGAVLPPVALDGPVLAIRKFHPESFTLEELTRAGTLDERGARLLAAAVASRQNIFLSGGTGSGKTTMLNVLADLVPADERIVTVEDSAELRIRGPANVVRLEAREANQEGKGEVSLRQLVKMALRLRPDRIILGEVRGAEALDMLQAMHTGHRGAMSSGHSNSALDMLGRLETMALMADVGLSAAAIRRQIGGALDFVVHLERREEGRRIVREIRRVDQWTGREPDTEVVYQREE